MSLFKQFQINLINKKRINCVWNRIKQLSVVGYLGTFTGDNEKMQKWLQQGWKPVGSVHSVPNDNHIKKTKK